MGDTSEIIVWHEHELKVRELYAKHILETQRLSIEFSKLIVTNLVWINAAGLGSLPVVASFIGIATLPWAQKFSLLIAPIIGFAVGLFSALFCALAIYFNYMHHATFYSHSCDSEISAIRTIHPLYSEMTEFRQNVDKARAECIRNGSKSELFVNTTYYVSHLLGWMSAISFVVACYYLLKITPSS
ncbi:hypothetical protein [Methylocystis sp.]|uniref:hypothetical protein n=1 Tax=Methylocystis sp. TaxID=1911079 RepID=UPI003DA5D5A9